MRGFDKVRGEWSLMALCYNFTRVLSIVGLARFVAYLAKYQPEWLNGLLQAVLAAVGRLRTFLAHLCPELSPTAQLTARGTV